MIPEGICGPHLLEGPAYDGFYYLCWNTLKHQGPHILFTPGMGGTFVYMLDREGRMVQPKEDDVEVIRSAHDRLMEYVGE